MNQPVPTTYAESESDLTTARVGTIDQTGKEAPMETAAATPPPAATPEPAPAATPAPAPEADRAATPQATPAATPSATPQEMPHTASPYPLVGLAGLLALAGFGVLRVASKRA